MLKLGYYNDITRYLKTIVKSPFDSSKNFEPYFQAPCKAHDDEKEKYGEDVKVICFRSLGYTIGHVYIDGNFKILKFYVYNRPVVKDYDMSASKLEKTLDKMFIGTTLVLEGDPVIWKNL